MKERRTCSLAITIYIDPHLVRIYIMYNYRYVPFHECGKLILIYITVDIDIQ